MKVIIKERKNCLRENNNKITPFPPPQEEKVDEVVSDLYVSVNNLIPQIDESISLLKRSLRAPAESFKEAIHELLEKIEDLQFSVEDFLGEEFLSAAAPPPEQGKILKYPEEEK